MPHYDKSFTEGDGADSAFSAYSAVRFFFFLKGGGRGYHHPHHFVVIKLIHLGCFDVVYVCVMCVWAVHLPPDVNFRDPTVCRHVETR